MKKGIAFVLAMLFFGIIAAVEIVMILMSVAVPTMSQYLLTVAEKADWERMGKFAGYFIDHAFMNINIAVFVVAAIVVSILFLLTINPQVTNAVKHWRSKSGAKLLIVLLAVLGLLYLLGFGLDFSFFRMPRMGKLVQFLIMIFGTGFLWLVAGDQGWAGDFSAWGKQQDVEPRRTFLLGALAGAATFALGNLLNWSFNKYFILVSEVLDRSGEMSYQGYQLLTFGLLVMLGIVCPILAGIVIALAPVRRDNREAGRRLILPVGALSVLCIVLAAGYGYAGKKYDLDKENLASILNIADKASVTRTVVTFLPSKKLPVAVQEWPLQVSGSGVAMQNTMELSEENLKKVEAYIDAHRDGSIFLYAAYDILMKGYNALWDKKNGLAWQIKAAESNFLPRLLLLARFRYLPATEESVKLLELYSDEKTWFVGGKSALSIAAGYRHFGNTVKADQWLQKAQKRGADLSKADFMRDPVVAHGTIRGKIVMNGKPLAGVKIALLGYYMDRNKIENFSITDLMLSRSLADVTETRTDGLFAFDRLGSGKYLLAMMTDKETVPFDIGPQKIRARNVPGLIQIGPTVARDLGIIEITVER